MHKLNKLQFGASDYEESPNIGRKSLNFKVCLFIFSNGMGPLRLNIVQSLGTC